jgi:hypothetical protein
MDDTSLFLMNDNLLEDEEKPSYTKVNKRCNTLLLSKILKVNKIYKI